MSSLVCTCGSTDIDRDPSRGDAVCTKCGLVLEDRNIVSEVEFDERGGGNVVGQFVSNDQTMGNAGARFGLFFTKESKQNTLNNGKRKLEDLGARLGLNSRIISVAFNFYKMAVTQHTTKGHRITHMLASCLYLAYRIESSTTDYMLMDFSDAIQVNVWELGATFSFLLKKFHIRLPTLDPIHYVARFAAQLELGNKLKIVSETATRLVHRMKKDWLHHGRRPSGICGSSLLLACRIHGFNRDVEDIVRVSKSSKSTIVSRLKEFSVTSTADLTVDEFHQVDLEHEHDPPSFVKGKERAERAEFEHINNMLESVTVDMELASLRKEIESKLNYRDKNHFAMYAALLDDAMKEEELGATVDTTLDDVKRDDTKRNLDRFLQSFDVSHDDIGDADSDKYGGLDPLTEGMDAITSETASSSGTPSQKKSTIDRLSQFSDMDDPIKYIIDRFGSDSLRPDLDSLGLSDEAIAKEAAEARAAKEREDAKAAAGESDSEISISSLDDEEIEGYLLTEKETAIKETMWRATNAQYLREVALKRKLDMEEKEKARLENEKTALLKSSDTTSTGADEFKKPGDPPSKSSRRAAAKRHIPAATPLEAFDRLAAATSKSPSGATTVNSGMGIVRDMIAKDYEQVCKSPRFARKSPKPNVSSSPSSANSAKGKGAASTVTKGVKPSPKRKDKSPKKTPSKKRKSSITDECNEPSPKKRQTNDNKELEENSVKSGRSGSRTRKVSESSKTVKSPKSGEEHQELNNKKGRKAKVAEQRGHSSSPTRTRKSSLSDSSERPSRSPQKKSSTNSSPSRPKTTPKMSPKSKKPSCESKSSKINSQSNPDAATSKTNVSRSLKVLKAKPKLPKKK